MLNHQLGFLEKNQNKDKIKAVKDGYKLITKKGDEAKRRFRTRM